MLLYGHHDAFIPGRHQHSVGDFDLPGLWSRQSAPLWALPQPRRSDFDHFLLSSGHRPSSFCRGDFSGDWIRTRGFQTYGLASAIDASFCPPAGSLRPRKTLVSLPEAHLHPHGLHDYRNSLVCACMLDFHSWAQHGC